MTSTTSGVHWAIQDVAVLPDSEWIRYEIIDGELFVTRSPHHQHQHVIGCLFSVLHIWSRENGLGEPSIMPDLIFKELARQFPWANKLNSMARPAAAERAWQSISRFYSNCKQAIRPVGFPQFKQHTRSVEYKTYQFRQWIEYFGHKYGKISVAVAPQSQECSNCGAIVKKSLSTRTHMCGCGCELERDHNAVINILRRGISTVGHTGAGLQDRNAWGDAVSTDLDPVQICKLCQRTKNPRTFRSGSVNLFSIFSS